MSSTTTDPVQQYLGRSWGLLLGFALASIALGVILMVWPQQTVTVVAVLMGLYLIISGVFELAASFSASEAGTGLRVFAGIAGALSILLGVFAFRSLSHAVAVLALLVGFSWLLRGIAEIVEGIADKDMPGRGWAITMGVIGALAGIVVLAWPMNSLSVLVWVVGITMVVLGVLELVGAFALRKLSRA